MSAFYCYMQRTLLSMRKCIALCPYNANEEYFIQSYYWCCLAQRMTCPYRNIAGKELVAYCKRDVYYVLFRLLKSTRLK